MKKLNLFRLLILSGLFMGVFPINHSQVLSQPEGINFNLSGNGCNSRVEYNPTTKVITLKPGLELSAGSTVKRSVCILRVTSSRNDQILVPLSIQGTTRNNGGIMNIAITTNSGANILSILKKDFKTTGNINVTHLFVRSEDPQCGLSDIVGANINVFGKNASLNLNDIRFTLETRKCP